MISTLNIQHIESLNDVVEQITGVPQRETVPDSFLRGAEQIEVVDLAPQALRDRLSGGFVYPAERIDAALSNYFRLGNLTALRELALIWLADEVDQALKGYRKDHGIDSTWEARERVVVAPGVDYGSSGEHEDFAGTISIGTQALHLLLVELVRSASRWAGATLLVNGHGGNLDAVRSAVRLWRAEGRAVAWVPGGPAGRDAGRARRTAAGRCAA